MTFLDMARNGLAIALAALLCACSSLPAQQPRAETVAIANPEQTPLGRMTAAVLPSDARSGFRLLPYGPNAFATRIALARLATRSLDVQYYLLAADNSGRALMRELRDAAARGVRVRVLIDDFYTAGNDELLLGLASHPNVELRLFNPFPAARSSQLGRFVASGFDFSRVDRRMHNKLFVADNAAAVAGGRNMADEYMTNAAGSNFVDMDVFAAGPVVRELSKEFDYYWNSEVVYPVERIARTSLDRPGLQAQFERATSDLKLPESVEVPANGIFEKGPDGKPITVPLVLVGMMNMPYELAAGRLGPLLWANARVLYDPITKTQGLNEQRGIEGTVTSGIMKWFFTARRQIKMISPYFVPSDSAIVGLREAQRAGVGVVVVTNSLASTDEPFAYAAYQRRIVSLLAAGVEIYELSPSLSVQRRKYGIFGARTGALHLKNAVVDDAQVFLGSMNLDQRSAVLNTELGLIIESPEMAAQLHGFADLGSSYRVRLRADGQAIEWVETNDDGSHTVYDLPPETTAWQRFKLRLVSPLIPDKEL